MVREMRLTLIYAPIDIDDVIKVSELPSPVGMFVEEGDPLFTDPVMIDDCPICFQSLPHDNSERVFKRCCGKVICCGCSHATFTVSDDDRCPFCRVPIETSDDEILLSLKKRIDTNDPIANENLSEYYREGTYGLQINCEKSFELLKLAESFGSQQKYIVQSAVRTGMAWGQSVMRTRRSTTFNWRQCRGAVLRGKVWPISNRTKAIRGNHTSIM